MINFKKMIHEVQSGIEQIFPWDLHDWLTAKKDMILLDIREPYEYEARHIEGSISVPRGILEMACDFGYHETVPELVAARERTIIVICRSGNRSLMATDVMQAMGFKRVYSLKTGIKGWTDSEFPLLNLHNETVDIEESDRYFNAPLREDQLEP